MLPEPIEGAAGVEGTFAFDEQARTFDRRAGVPPAAARRIAETLADVAAARPGDALLELGAGTGEIGRYVAASGVAYIAMDVSLPMLEVFGGKLESDGSSGALLWADASRSWPFRDGSIRVLFLSRSAHLLEGIHLVTEARRVASDGAIFVLGRVQRSDTGVRTQMRRAMRGFLAQRGIEGRSGAQGIDAVVSELEASGAERLPARTASTWTRVDSPAECIAAWRAKGGLAGRSLSPDTKEDVLRELEDWARARFGPLEAGAESEERYELTAVRLPERP